METNVQYYNNVRSTFEDIIDTYQLDKIAKCGSEYSIILQKIFMTIKKMNIGDEEKKAYFDCFKCATLLSSIFLSREDQSTKSFTDKLEHIVGVETAMENCYNKAMENFMEIKNQKRSSLLIQSLGKNITNSIFFAKGEKDLYSLYDSRIESIDEQSLNKEETVQDNRRKIS